MRGVRSCLIAIALLLPLAARAEDKDAARKASADGQKYYNLNQFSDALESFKRAYWNYEEPSFLYNIAQCHRLLGHKKDAIDFYRSYLRNAPPEAPNRVASQRMITELEAAIAQEKAVSTAPPQETLAESARPAPDAAVTTSMPSRASDKPVYKRGWFWGVVAGAVVVVGVGVGLGVGLGTSSTKDPTATFGHVGVN